MWKNYLVTALRNFKKNKIYSLINITGLVLGLTCSMLILLWVFDEYSYDRYNENGENIYRFLISDSNDNSVRGVIHPYKLKDILVANDSTLQIMNFQKHKANKLKCNEKVFSNEDIYFADSEVIKFFDLKLLKELPNEKFEIPFNIILSKSSALKLFGKLDCIGETINIDGDNAYTIIGVFEDLPKQSHHNLTIVVSANTIRKLYPSMFEDTRSTAANMYIYADGKEELQNVTESFKTGFNLLHKDDEYPAVNIEMQPLYDIYLNSSDLRWDFSNKGNINYVVGLSIAAFLILFLAVFNYINLSVAKNIIRFKEVAVRKVFGARRKQIVFQFVIESLLYFGISLFSSFLIVELLIPAFNNFTGKEYSFSILNIPNILVGMSLLLFVAIISVYPAIRISRYNPSRIFKTNFCTRDTRKGKLNINLGIRQLLIMLQFVITIFLLSSLYIVNDQMEMVFNSNLGFDKENVIIVSNPYDSKRSDRYQKFKNNISSFPNVISIGGGTNVPPDNINNYTPPRLPEWPQGEAKHMGLIAIDEGYFETLNSKITYGRNFNNDSELDKNHSVIINEQALKELDIDDPIGHQLDGVNSSFGKVQTIIGVVEDLYFNSMYSQVEPLVFHYKNWNSGNIIVKVSGNNINETMGMLESSWEKVSEEWPFSYKFMDESFDQLYKKESIMLDILQIFVLVAILISSLGLIGMVAFTTVRKTKEIGIRKILGASTETILKLLIKELVLLFLVANIMSIPLAYYFMDKWLINFAYRIEIGVIPFIISAFIIISIALITISFQTIKASIANPVESLRNE